VSFLIYFIDIYLSKIKFGSGGRTAGFALFRLLEKKIPPVLSFLHCAAPNRVLRTNPVQVRVFLSHEKRATLGSLFMAREAGLEPATSKLTASCSTIELLPNM
jgi:hypothetical protein